MLVITALILHVRAYFGHMHTRHLMVHMETCIHASIHNYTYVHIHNMLTTYIQKDIGGQAGRRTDGHQHISK